MENFPFPPTQMWDPTAAALGLEEDFVQVRPQQLKGEPITFCEVTVGPEEGQTPATTGMARQE